jgi:AcrR family transcriptional regulator
MNAHRSKSVAVGNTRLATARERIDRTAYELFSRHGIRAVGINAVIARSRVAKKTLYRHYPSKNDLALAFLRRREELWTRTWLQREIERQGAIPGEKLLAIFDMFDKWFRRPDFEACSFVKVLFEHGEHGDPLRDATVRHLDTIRSLVRQLAEDANVRDAGGLARQWQMLMMGSIVAAYAGDPDAATRAREIGKLLLARNGIASGSGARA